VGVRSKSSTAGGGVYARKKLFLALSSTFIVGTPNARLLAATGQLVPLLFNLALCLTN
jgi:hypothetical protein